MKIINREKVWKLVGYEPTKNQKAIHSSNSRFRVNIQGRRSGKSFGAAREILPYLLTPNTRGWIVAPNYDMCDKIARILKQDVIMTLRLPVAAKKEISGQLYYIKIAGLNSELSIRSADNLDSLVGEGLDYMVIDEAASIKKITWEQYLRPTLSDRNGWALFTSTPRGFNWLYDLWVRGGDPEFQDWESWQHPSTDSPYFLDDVDQIKKELTYETFAQEYLASFETYAGKCFPMQREVHVQKELEYNPDLPIYCSIDFGYRMPAVGWFQVDDRYDKPKVYVIDEICHEENIKTEVLAEMIKAKRYPTIAYYGDPAGGGVQAQSGIGDIEQFRRKGIRVRYKTDRLSRNIASGVSMVRSWFEDSDGEPHIFFSERCKGAIESVDNYRYPEKKGDQRLKEEPLKDGRNDHFCDAMRYFFVNRFGIKRRQAGVINW
jgi:hypothetical protein